MKKFLLLIFIYVFVFASSNCFAKQTESEEEHAKNTVKYLNLEWWENYKDDILIDHLKDLYIKNYDLKNAELKIKENEKIVKMQFANELPALNLSAYAGREFKSSVQEFGSMSIPNYAQNNFLLPLTASYEIDIWGKNRLKTKSIEQELEIIKQMERATYISLTSDFASDYFNLIKADKLLALQDEIIKIQQDIVSKIKIKNEAGLCSLNEVYAEQKLLTLLKEEKNNIEQNRDTLENALRAYLTLKEGEIARSDFSSVAVFKDFPEKIDSEIVVNRPDFLQQESAVKKAGYDVRIARKELLPGFVISGQIGLNAYRFDDLFKTSTQLANAGIFPTFDLFSGGRKTAFLKFKKYQYDEVLNNYQKTVVEGIKEVNTALVELKTAKKNYYDAVESLELQNKMFNLVSDKERIGSASKLEVLYAKQTALEAEKQKISNTINFVISTVSVYKASGGKNPMTSDVETL